MTAENGLGKSSRATLLTSVALILSAVCLHAWSFPKVSTRYTRVLSGRHLFNYESYSWNQVFEQIAHQAALFVQSHLLPLLLLWAAYRLARKREGAQSLPELSLGWLALSYTVALFGPALYQQVLDGLAGSGDEFSYFFQSRVFRADGFSTVGEGWLDFMQMPFISSAPWMSMYPPGWSGFLALFPKELVWLGPPLVCVLSLLGLHRLGVETVGSSAARWGVFVTALSPGFFWQGGTYFPNHALLAGLAGGAALFLWGSRREKALLIGLSGFLFGWALSNRPVECALFAAAVACWYLLEHRRVRVDWRAVALCLPGIVVGALFLGSYFREYGSFYSFIDKEPRHHLVAGIWNAFYPLLRQVEWWSPFFLCLLVLRLKRRALQPAESFLLLHGGLTYLAFSCFLDNGQIEFGSRYLLTGWAMLSPIVGLELQRQLGRLTGGGRASATLAVAVFTLSAMPTLYLDTYRDINWPLLELRDRYPANGLFFVRSTAGSEPTGLLQNTPEQTQRILLFLDPDRTGALRRTQSERPAFVIDWRENRYTFTPFEDAAVFDGFSYLAGAGNLARFAGDRERAIGTWLKVPSGDPFFVSARLNAAGALFLIGKPQEAEECLVQASAAGAPPEAIQSVRKRFVRRG